MKCPIGIKNCDLCRATTIGHFGMAVLAAVYGAGVALAIAVSLCQC